MLSVAHHPLWQEDENECLFVAHRLELENKFSVSSVEKQLGVYNLYVKYNNRKEPLPCVVFPHKSNLEFFVKTWLLQHASKYYSCRSMYAPYAQVWCVFPSSETRDTFWKVYGRRLQGITPRNEYRPMLDVNHDFIYHHFFTDIGSNVLPMVDSIAKLRQVLISENGKILAKEYRTWILVLFALINRYKNTDFNMIAKRLWHDFSQLWPEKYSESECERLWEQTKIQRINGIGIGSVIYLLQKKSSIP